MKLIQDEEAECSEIVISVKLEEEKRNIKVEGNIESGVKLNGGDGEESTEIKNETNQEEEMADCEIIGSMVPKERIKVIQFG